MGEARVVHPIGGRWLRLRGALTLEAFVLRHHDPKRGANRRAMRVLAGLSGWAVLSVVCLLTVIAAVPTADRAQAQTGWQLPWETEPRQRPQPRRYRERREPRRAPDLNAQRNDICLSLEQQLVQQANNAADQRGRLPQINQQIRSLRRLHRRARNQLERARCYNDYFISRTLRRTGRCLRLDRERRDAKRQIADLEIQRQRAAGGSRGNNQDEIIAALARNNCGRNYQREARRRRRADNPFSSMFWQDNDGASGYGNDYRRTYRSPLGQTYRTMCVRLCDGYYFPVSFATLQNHIQRDVNVCQQRCAAPAELYIYQNPGSSVEQMVSATTQQPYARLQSAWRYRKQFVPGCSCKASEYVQPGQEAPPTGSTGPEPRDKAMVPAFRARASEQAERR